MVEQRGPARDTACRTCGAPVLAFTVDVFSTPVQLEPHDLPIDTPLQPLADQYRLWRYLGPRIGWDPHYVAERDWRPLRAEHRCPNRETAQEGAHA